MTGDIDDKETTYLSNLLMRVPESIHSEKNRVRYTMNGFIIALGAYHPQLSKYAIAIASDIGKIIVDVGNTACKVPYAPEYIKQVQAIISNKSKTKFYDNLSGN